MHTADDFVLPVSTRSTRGRTSDGKEQSVSPSDAFVERDTLESECVQSQLGRPAISGHEPLTIQSDITPPSTAASDLQLTNVESAEPAESQAQDNVAVDGHPDVDPQGADEEHISRVISASDYEQDEEFMNAYKYADNGELTGITRVDKPTLIMADRYIIEGGILYRIDTPRQKRLARMTPLVKRLCVPKRFRYDIIQHVHNHYGLYAAVTLYHALSARYFWKSLFRDVNNFCRTCETCQRTKINLSHRFAPLNPIPVPNAVGTRFALDHKVLLRTTSAGSNAVLVVVECFSGFPHFICVPDMTAETTARALVKHVIPVWGIPLQFQMDKEPSFVAALFKHIAALLGIRHVTTAARSSRSNGQAEACVKRLCEHLKYYARDDLSIEEVIPMCEINVRSMPHSKLQLSTYEIVFGRPMRLEIPGDPPPAPPEIPADKLTYYRWLTTELQRLHKAVKQTRDEQKEEDKKIYDQAHNVVTPTWQINDRVWLSNDTVRPGSSKIITRQRFTGPFIINNVVKGRDNI